jgi:hypothetical protein
MKQWLSIERACGNRISKQDLLAEFLGRLQLTANELRNKAQQSEVSALERAELLRDAKEWEDRKMKTCKTEHYRKNLSFS